MTRESMKKMQLGGLTMEEYIEQGYETDVFILIDEIFDNFESRTCESCKYDRDSRECNICIGRPYRQINDNYGIELLKDFYCNKWQEKEK